MTLKVDFSLIDTYFPNREDAELEKKAVLHWLSYAPNILFERVTHYKGQKLPRIIEIKDGVLHVILNKERLGDKKFDGSIKVVGKAIRFEEDGKTARIVPRKTVLLPPIGEKDREQVLQRAEKECTVEGVVGRHLGSHRYFSEKEGIPKGSVEKMVIYSNSWCEGGELFKAIQKKKLDDEKKIKGAQSLLQQLAVLHQQNIAHRDINPANILIGPSDTLLLQDFDLSESIANRPLNTPVQASGTMEYAAPELFVIIPFLLKNVLPPDIWSLGVTIFTMFTENFPFWVIKDASGEVDNAITIRNLRALARNPKQGEQQIADMLNQARTQQGQPLPKEIRDLLDKMLVIDPNQRSRVDELLEVTSDSENEEEKKDPFPSLSAPAPKQMLPSSSQNHPNDDEKTSN